MMFFFKYFDIIIYKRGAKMKVVVIGAGASGLVAAIYAAKSGNEVILLERNNSVGKKILITGNGKCNYFNSFMDLSHYYSSDKEKLKNIITEDNTAEILSFFESLGIMPRIKNGYYYPFSNKATSIRDALLKECHLLNIKIINNFLVEEVTKEEKFVIKSLNDKIIADKVVLALGSKAFPKTGSDGLGYKIASSFGHSIIEVLPALTGLIGNEKYFTLWDGVRFDVKLSLLENEKLIKEEKGQLQFTNYGISGICAFNLSSLISKGLYLKKKEEVVINFLYDMNIETVSQALSFLNDRSEKVTGRNVFELLEGILDYKLVNVILKKSNVSKEKYYDELSKKQKNNLALNLVSFKLEIIDTNSFENAQVCIGGVSFSEVDENMQSKIVPGLYFAGEILDVSGDCGGYNLAFAWITGMLSGKGTSL